MALGPPSNLRIGPYYPGFAGGWSTPKSTASSVGWQAWRSTASAAGSAGAILTGDYSLMINLAWDANPSGDNVTNYVLYAGDSAGNYTSATTGIGNVNVYAYRTTSHSTVYMALTAQNAIGESTFSSEIHN